MKKKLINLFGFKKPWYDQLFIYAIFLAGIVPTLFFSIEFQSLFVLPKIFWFSIIMFIAFIMFAIKAIHEDEVVLRKDKFNRNLILYIGLLILSTFFSINLYTSLFGTYLRFWGLFTTILLLLLAFLIFNFLKKKEELIILLSVLYIVSIIVVALGLLQHYDLYLSELNFTGVSQRAFSTFGHANHFGGFIVQFIFVSFALASLAKNKFIKYSILFLNIFYIWALFVTASRGALLALILCSILFFISWLFLNKSKGLKKILIGMLIAIIFFGTSGYFARGKIAELSIVKRTINTVQFIQNGHTPDRISWIYSSLEMIKDRPIFGYGISTYQDIYPQYRRLDFTTKAKNQDTMIPESAHNEYLTIAATQGVPALFVYLLLIGSVIFNAYKVAFRIKNKQQAIAILFLTISLFAYLFQVLVSFGMIVTMIPFFMLLGITHSYTMSFNKEKTSIIKGGFAYFFAISLLIFVAVNMFFVRGQVKADKLLRDISYMQIDPTYLYKEPITTLVESVGYNPYSWYLKSQLAGYYLRQGAKVSGNIEQAVPFFNAAEKSYKDAIKMNQYYPSLYFNLGSVYRNTAHMYKNHGDLEVANNLYELSLEQVLLAYKYGVNNTMYIIELGNAYMYLDDHQNALKFYKEAMSLRPREQMNQKQLEALDKNLKLSEEKTTTI